jgi:hypothetical protein
VARLYVLAVAAPYARQYPETAAGWLSQYQGQANYETILQQIILSSAQSNPASAARLLQVAPASLQAASAGIIASTWVRDDIAGAARWAVNVGDGQARASAVRTVADAWASRDPATAQRWALGLPRGEVRDQALVAIVSRFARPDFDIAVDSRIIDAIDGDAARSAAERLIQVAL